MQIKLQAVKPGHVFLLLSLFWIAWAYTELMEHRIRQQFTAEVTAFMNKGDRFTSRDGYNLCVRLRHMEMTHHGENTPACKKPKDAEP